MADVDDIEGGGGSMMGGGGGGGVGPGGAAPRYGGTPPTSTGSSSAGSGYGLADAPPGGPVSGLYDSTGKSRRRHCGAAGGLYQSLLTAGAAGGNAMSDSLLQKSIVGLAVMVMIGALMFPLQMRIMWLVYGAVAFGALVSMWLSKNVLSCDDGTAEMRAVVCFALCIVVYLFRASFFTGLTVCVINQV